MKLPNASDKEVVIADGYTYRIGQETFGLDGKPIPGSQEAPANGLLLASTEIYPLKKTRSFLRF